jgi:putative tryptophan/tyrosine transport system substrate-binding protein
MRRIGLAVVVIVGLLSLALAAASQSPEKHRIGYLATFPDDPKHPIQEAFIGGLRDHGYIEGRNLSIERRFSYGRPERLPDLVTDLLRLDVSLIIAIAPGPSRAAKDATATVPIVFVTVADPIGMGLVTNYRRPGGNVTGLATIEFEAFTAKQLEIIKEALPKASRIAILMNPTNPVHARTLPQAQAAADMLRVKLQRLEARDAAELATAFEAASRARADLVNVYGDPLTLDQGARIAELAMRHRLPTMHFFREAVEAGGLLGFGPDLPHIWRNVGKYVDKILKGAKPGDIPVEQPTKYELVVNLKIAKALGLTIPQSLLLRADQVIE